MHSGLFPVMWHGTAWQSLIHTVLQTGRVISVRRGLSVWIWKTWDSADRNSDTVASMSLVSHGGASHLSICNDKMMFEFLLLLSPVCTWNVCSAVAKNLILWIQILRIMNIITFFPQGQIGYHWHTLKALSLAFLIGSLNSLGLALVVCGKLYHLCPL